jgi:hypothetical protein
MSSDWRSSIHKRVVVIEGDDEKFHGQVCITDHGRPFAFGRHAWSRAEWHIRFMTDVPFWIREKAALYCRDVMNSISMDYDRPKPPQWSWKGIPGKL